MTAKPSDPYHPEYELPADTLRVERILPLLRNAAQLIESQRNIIARLEPKAEAYDALLTVIGFARRDGGEGPMERDIAWTLREAIEKFETAGASAAEIRRRIVEAEEREELAELN